MVYLIFIRRPLNERSLLSPKKEKYKSEIRLFDGAAPVGQDIKSGDVKRGFTSCTGTFSWEIEMHNVYFDYTHTHKEQQNNELDVWKTENYVYCSVAILVVNSEKGTDMFQNRLFCASQLCCCAKFIHFPRHKHKTFYIL